MLFYYLLSSSGDILCLLMTKVGADIGNCSEKSRIRRNEVLIYTEWLGKNDLGWLTAIQVRNYFSLEDISEAY